MKMIPDAKTVALKVLAMVGLIARLSIQFTAGYRTRWTQQTPTKRLIMYLCGLQLARTFRHM